MFSLDSRLFQAFRFNYTPDWTIWSSKLKMFWGGADPSRSSSGSILDSDFALKSKFGHCLIPTPNFWPVHGCAPVICLLVIDHCHNGSFDNIRQMGIHCAHHPCLLNWVTYLNHAPWMVIEFSYTTPRIFIVFTLNPRCCQHSVGSGML